MKKISLTILLLGIVLKGIAQVDTVSTNLYQNDGRIGIGTDIPKRQLDISADPGSGYSAGIRIAHNGLGLDNYGWEILQYCPDCSMPGGLVLYTRKNDIYQSFNFSQEGNLAIGFGLEHYIPNEKLEVNGNVLIKKDNGIILTSPNGTEFKITVDDNGNLNTSLLESSTSNQELEMKNEKIEIYPNPASNELTIKTHDYTIQNIDIELYNLDGKMLFMKNYNQISSSINIADLKSGVYIIKVKDQNGDLIKTDRIVKH